MGCRSPTGHVATAVTRRTSGCAPRSVASRPKTLVLGRREYVPEKVGDSSDGDVPFVVDASVIGNGNGGHEYGVTLPDADRWALVEDLKTL